ncbi:MAG: tagaturonate reductase [Clostridia bacterium]|nr:tagaturonate reductase [Clostridia bacterium]
MISKKVQKTYGDCPVKVLQIGEGNFLRAFADFIIEKMNGQGIFNGSVVMCQPNGSDFADVLNEQNCLYTVVVRGKENGETVDNSQVITSVKECVNPKKNFEKILKYACEESLQVVISNTTEAGIYYNPDDKIDSNPPASFPAKLTKILYERYKFFDGNLSKGLLILPAELIEKNGDNLKKIVLKYVSDWGLPTEFISWLNDACCFANTLVDRIVTGYPKDEAEKLCERFGYKDNCIDTCEPFLFWAIECDEKWAEKFPANKTGLNVVFAKDITPYKTRKVRILNGAHTVSVLGAFHCGYDIVLQMMNDSTLKEYIRKAMFSEIIPTIDLPESELSAFANAVIERFENPFIKHRLLDISLNSVSKYKARCLDTLIDFYNLKGELPSVLTFGLAALIYFYKGEFDGEKYFGTRNGEKYEIRDNCEVLKFFNDAWHNENTVKAVLSNENFWGRNLTEICGMEELVSQYLDDINSLGMKAAIEKIL